MQHIPKVVPPEQLEDNPVGGLVGLPFRLILLDLVVDGSGRQAAMGQPGAELGAVIAAQHPIAHLEVGCHQVCVPQVVLEPCKRFCFASFEAVHCL